MKKNKRVIYKSKSNGQYGWRLISKNGKKIACSGELYHSKKHCIKMLNAIALMLVESEFVDETIKK